MSVTGHYTSRSSPYTHVSYSVCVCVCVEESVNNNKMLRCHSSECTSSSRLMLRPTQGYAAVGQRDRNREGNKGRELHGRKAVETRKDIRVHFGMPMRTLVGHPDTYAHTYTHTYTHVCAMWRYICISCDSDSDSGAGSGSVSPNYMKL